MTKPKPQYGYDRNGRVFTAFKARNRGIPIAWCESCRAYGPTEHRHAR